MTILLWGLGILIALFVVIVVTPVRLTLIASGGSLPERLEVALWGVQVYGGAPWRSSPDTVPSDDRNASESEGPASSGRSALSSGARLGPIMKVLAGPPGRRLAYRLARAITLREGWMQVALGLNDPVQTGLIAGPAYALNAYLSRINVEIVPEFTGAAFGLSGRIALQTSLARMSGPPLLFLFEPGALRALRGLGARPPRHRAHAQTQTPR